MQTTDASETCGSKNSSDGKSKELAGRGVGTVREGWMGGKVNDTIKWMSQPYVNCKRLDEKMVNDKVTGNKVVILIDREGKHQIKQSQTVISTKQPLNGSRYSVPQSKAIVRDSDGRVTLHVPCVGHEEIFNV